MDILSFIKNIDNTIKIMEKSGYICSFEVYKSLFLNSHIIFPEEIINILYNKNIELFKDIYELCILYNKKGLLINEIKINKKKEIKTILEWLEKLDIFKIDNNIDKSIINIKYRINQEFSINRLEKEGLISGIECQATGSGKTFIILYYLDYMIRKYKNPKIILFTERVNIFNDLFEFNKLNPNQDKILEWKNKGICDLTNYNIFNFVTFKKSNWYDYINNNNNCIIVINRAFLTKEMKYKNIKKLDLIIHDECHNATSKQCYDFLLYFKNKSIPIIGFSATPIRTGSKQIEKLCNIYSDENNKINLLSDFSFIKAIENKLIVKPVFHWFPFNSNEKKYEVNNTDIEIILSCLNEKIKNSPYKKIIAWCGLISLTEKWAELLYENINKYSNLKNLRFFIDINYTGKYDFKNYEEFKELESNGIMLCAQKHREGSDIKNLDTCIFLDKVKSRDALVFIQSIGRVLRINDNKENGFIFDGIDIKNYDIMINKIFEYYQAFQNISNIDYLTDIDYNNRIDDIYNNINYENDILTLKIGNSNININTKQINFNINKFNKLKINISKRKKNIIFNHEIFNNNFTFSKIKKCIIDDKDLIIINFKPLINYIYNYINDREFIIKNTILNIKDGKIYGKGFNYNEKYNFSIQGTDSHTSMKEIVNICLLKNIKIKLEIKLKNSKNVYFNN